MATKKKPNGRPTAFKPGYIKTVYRLSLLGCTDAQMAAALGVALSTFHLFKLKHPRFSDAVKDGKEEADSKVAGRLHSDALNGVTTAQIFWLKNRQPKLWRDVHRHEVTGKDGDPVQVEHMSKDQIRALLVKRGDLAPDGRLLPQSSSN